MNANSWNFWLTFISSAFFVVGGVWSIIRLAHNVLARSVTDRLNDIHKETQTNGGSSLRDAIDRIEHKLDAVTSDLDRHLGFHDALDK